MRNLHRVLALAIVMILPAASHAQDTMRPIPLNEPSKWRYFSDQVMGGVSEGSASFVESGGETVLRLSGKVSTENRGGFIQARANLEMPLPAQAQGVVLEMRGDSQTYFVHLRTGRTLLPWQYYQASFEATEVWQEIRIPFEDFKPSGPLLSRSFDAGSVRSIALVAFGRDHTADLTARAVGFY
tara:strand:+ start:1809 stop:2360 length:552 start_codon:yes stop_codon:yes gene_type:complete